MRCFDVLWASLRPHHGGEIAVTAWGIGALTSAGAIAGRQGARGWNVAALVLHLAMRIGLAAVLMLWRPTRLF